MLSVGGRYVCVTLAQESVIKLAVEHFVQLGWAVRLHCLQQASGEQEDSFALPVFVLVCTKFRQPMSTPILEICLGEDGAPTRLTQVLELLSAVREHQAYSVLRKRLRTGTDASSNVSLTLCHAKTGLPRYTLTVQDCSPGAKVPRSNHFAIFIGELSYYLMVFIPSYVGQNSFILFFFDDFCCPILSAFCSSCQFLRAARQPGSTAPVRGEGSWQPVLTFGAWLLWQCTGIRSTQTCKLSSQSSHRW